MHILRPTVLAAGLIAVVATAVPAHAITFGQPDGDLHPNVGTLLTDYDPDSPGPESFCTGTLIAPQVVLTAAHCGGALAPGTTDVLVSFDSDFDDDDATPDAYSGTFVPHPDFGFSGPGGKSDPHDIAVILLDQAPAGITPAQLPTAGLLDQLKSGHTLDDRLFTAVGYGVVRNTKTGGPHGFSDPEGVRRYALQTSLALTKHWLTLSMQPSTGDGGTCYGDSGGPHFLGGTDSNLIVSITVTGDTVCRATDATYRLDTTSARAFLGEYVTLP
jgi:hypothetical protein